MKKGNLIILAGSKRAGKTTVSNYLQKLGYVTLNFDYLLDAYDNSLKEHTKEMEFSFFNNFGQFFYTSHNLRLPIRQKRKCNFKHRLKHPAIDFFYFIQDSKTANSGIKESNRSITVKITFC